MQQRLEQHYLRLLRRFDLQAADTTLQSLAETLFCTRRHVRVLLNQMSQAGAYWVRQHAGAVMRVVDGLNELKRTRAARG